MSQVLVSSPPMPPLATLPEAVSLPQQQLHWGVSAADTAFIEENRLASQVPSSYLIDCTLLVLTRPRYSLPI